MEMPDYSDNPCNLTEIENEKMQISNFNAQIDLITDVRLKLKNLNAKECTLYSMTNAIHDINRMIKESQDDIAGLRTNIY